MLPHCGPTGHSHADGVLEDGQGKGFGEASCQLAAGNGEDQSELFGLGCEGSAEDEDVAPMPGMFGREQRIGRLVDEQRREPCLLQRQRGGARGGNGSGGLGESLVSHGDGLGQIERYQSALSLPLVGRET